VVRHTTQLAEELPLHRLLGLAARLSVDELLGVRPVPQLGVVVGHELEYWPSLGGGPTSSPQEAHLPSPRLRASCASIPLASVWGVWVSRSHAPGQPVEAFPALHREPPDDSKFDSHWGYNLLYVVANRSGHLNSEYSPARWVNSVRTNSKTVERKLVRVRLPLLAPRLLRSETAIGSWCRLGGASGLTNKVTHTASGRRRRPRLLPERLATSRVTAPSET
jgi:hypothetical protein